MEFKQVITANFEKQLRRSTATVGRDAEQRGPSSTTSRSTACIEVHGSTACQKCILSEKAPDMNSLRGKGSCGSQFQRLNHSQGLCCPYTCGEVMHDGEKLLTSWQPGNRDREEGARDDIHPSKSYSQWPAPSNHVLPSSSPLNYEVINDLVPLMKSELLGSNHVLKAHHLTMEPLRLLRTF